MFRSKLPQVLVRHDGRWVRGHLIDTVTDFDGLSEGLVRFVSSDGQRRREWRHVTDLRPAMP
jgi:hypothetical protein